MSDELEAEENNNLSFLPTPLLNSTIVSNGPDDESQYEDNLNSSMTHQYITERLIRKISRQNNLWMIKKLDLTLTEKGSYIKKIKRIENLDGLVQLENLSLSHNVIEKIENLSHLKSLRVLNLSYNMIERIENISSLTNLEILNLSHNRITHLPYKIFKQLQRIRTLDVSHNEIAEIKQIRDLRLLGNLQDFSFNDNPVETEAPHSMDTAVFYLRGLDLLNGSPVTAEMRAEADKRYQQDEVNALQDVILGKTRMIDAVSKEREEVVKALKEKKNIEEKLRRSGNTSMLRISELEEELANTKKLLEQRTNELTSACYKHYALEQELSMYKVDARFRDIGPPPDVLDTAVDEYVEESGYVSKAPLYPVQYDMRIPSHTENIEHYRDKDYTEPLPDDNKRQLLEQQIKDKERDKRKLEQKLADLEKELAEKQNDLDETQKRLEEIEKKLAEEKKIRDEMEIEMELKNEELEHLRDVEKRLIDAEAEVDDLHASLQSKGREVKELRNQLTMTNATGMELEHMKARLKKKEDELEKERRAHEEARRGFQEKQRELQRRASQLSKSTGESDMLRAERDALLDKLDDLRDQLRSADEERAELEEELDRVKRDQDRLRRDASYVQKMFEDKETETEMLAGELDRTRDIVSALQDENRELKDQAIQVLSESIRPENEILHQTLDELEKAQAENARLMRERSATTPNLTREALRRSRDRVAELEDENAELRDILNASRGSALDPDDLARRILRFLEDRLPRYTESQPVRESLDLLPIIKLLLEERDKRREPVNNTNQNPQDLIRLLEDLLKDRNRQTNQQTSPIPQQQQQQPIINVNIPEQSSPRRTADDTVLSERYLRAGSPIRASTPGPTKVYIREEADVEYDPEVIHLISRRAQTDRQRDGQTETIINIDNRKEKKNKRKRVIITNDSESSVDETPDVLVLDKRREKSTNTNVHVLAEEMLNRFEKSTQMRDDRERERREAEKDKEKLDRLIDEVESIRQGIREAATQTNNVVLDSVQKKLDEALTRTNSLASCGHEDLISQLRSNVASAEREIDMLRDVIRDRDIEQENALTEFKIDGLGETIRDHNRSLHNLQEVLREAITSRDTASRDRPRDVIIQPRDTDSNTNSEIREIQKTLLELQYSLKHVAEKQVQEKPERVIVKEPEVQHNTACLHCTNCKRENLDLEAELRKVKQELAETMNVKVEKGDLEKLRAEHTTLSIDMERMRAERNHLNEVLGQYKTQLSDIEQDKRARYHELLEINDRIAESERSMAENKATEKRAVDALRQESEELKKTISDLNMQRDHMIQEAAQTQLNLKHERKVFEEEMKQRKQIFEETSNTTTARKEQELGALETRMREREGALGDLEGEIRARQTDLHQLKLEETQIEKQNEILRQQLDRQIADRRETLDKNEEKIREVNVQIEEVNQLKKTKELEVKEMQGKIGNFKDSLSQLERAKENKNAELRSMTTKIKETETKLLDLQTEVDGAARERESVKSELNRQQDHLENLNSEISGLNEKKHQKKERLKQLQEDCETLDRNIREKRSASVGQTTKKNDLEKEIRELESRQKQYVEQVEDLAREVKSLDFQKQEELSKVTELKNNFEAIKTKRAQLQDSFSVEEEKIKDCVQTMRGEQASLEGNLKTLEHKIESLDRDIVLKSENLLRLSEEEERNKAILAELEMSKVSATNELDEHLNSAIKEKYALSTDITALKREKEQLKSQQDTLTGELQKLRNEATVLREKIRNDKTVCEQLQTTCSNAERQYKDYCNLAEQTVQQMNNLHKNIVAVEKELQAKRSDLRDSNTKLEQIQAGLQDRQEKLHLLERKLLSYSQRLSSSKATLEENQNALAGLALQKSDLESELGTLKREIDSLEGSKQRANEELNNQRQTLDNLRKDLAACQRQHKQEMTKYNKLMREKTKYDSEVKSAKASCDSYTQNLARMKEDEHLMKERMGELSRDLAAVSHEYKEKSASLRSVEELKSRTSHLDDEIKQKSEVLSKYDEKLGEITKIKEAAMEKELLLKDSETKVANLQNQIEELTKTSQEKQQSDHATTTGLKKNLKKLKKHLKSQMESSSQLKKELAEQAAAAKTLELDLHAQRDAHNSILAALEEDNAALHSKCEEQLLEIETLRLELTAARHNLGTKQAELTFVAEDVFNKSVNADIDNRLAALGARDEIRNELMYSITEMNRNKRDILSDLERMRPTGQNDDVPTRDMSTIIDDRKILDNINYKLNQIESTLNKDTLTLSSPMRTGTFADPLLTTEDSMMNSTDRHELAATGDSAALYSARKPRHPSISSLDNTQPRSQIPRQDQYFPRSLNSDSISHAPTPSPDLRQTPGPESGRNSRITPASDQGYLTGQDPDTLSTEQDQWYNHVD